MIENIYVGRNLLETLTSALYESPIILFREYVQNSLDAYNDSQKNGYKEIDDFCVEINIDKATRTIRIKDNGYGIENKADFDKDMLSFGDSRKEDKSQFIGFRGIGRISAVPFCEKLTFINKAIGQNHRNICIWKGETFKELINNDYKDTKSFEDVIKKIVVISDEESNDENHYFEVVIENYSKEVEEVIENKNFEINLRKLLPLKYDASFTKSEEIIKRYNDFMNERFQKYMCCIKLNGEELTKRYTDKEHILASDLIFVEIRDKSTIDGVEGDKAGIMWFTFNQLMTAKRNDKDYGIMVRSKNVLMGSNDTFADLCEDSSEHVASYSQLAATLRGVYGELLINSINLKDNARRDWFKMDEYSLGLKYQIIDFMKRLYKYRYAASNYFNNEVVDKTEELKQDLKDALIHLVEYNQNRSADTVEVMISDAPEKRKVDVKNTYSDEDLPRETKSFKRDYDKIMSIIEKYYIAQNNYEEFLKVRAFVKKNLQDEKSGM